MRSKREVLEQLKRDELLAAVDRFELTVEDRRLRSELVDTLGSSRRAELAIILEDLRLGCIGLEVCPTGEAPGGVVGFLAVDRDVADLAAVRLDELLPAACNAEQWTLRPAGASRRL